MATSSFAFALTSIENASEDIWPGAADGPLEMVSGTTGDRRTINETFSRDTWSTAFINGDQLPGVCTLSDGTTDLFVDHPKPDGQDGGVLILKGKKPSDFQILVMVWTKPQWLVLQQRIGQYWRSAYKTAKNPPAIQVRHPGLALYGISSAALIGIGFPRPGELDGSMVFPLKFRENMPPGKKRVTKTVSKHVVDKDIAKDSGPNNQTPTPPSKNRKNLGPKGPKAAP